MQHKKNTKIVCTLGPSSDSVSEITALIQAGMNVARLNFSHGEHSDHAKIIKNIRKAEKDTQRSIGIMQDLQGPKIRLGELPPEGIQLKRGETVEITTEKIIGKKDQNKALIPIQYKAITKDVKNKDIVLIQDGLIELSVIKVSPKSITCKVKFGGIIKSRNGVNLPKSLISSQTITEKDKKDLIFGLSQGVDFVALSFVKDEKDILQLRKLMEKSGKIVPIIAKIERHEAVNNLEKIIRESDGVMVARGDLAADIPAEQVPVVQKRIIALANKYAKPVITATQVLQSMISEARATRAEISDAANAVFDGTDAIMLSNESAVGKYPAKATATLSKVAATIENEIQKHEDILEKFSGQKSVSTTNAACSSACKLALDSKADYLVIYTSDGYTAKQVAKFRHFIPIITITPNKTAGKSLTLTWGINKVFIKKFPQNSELTNEIFKFLKQQKAIKKGSEIVVICNASKKESIISTYKY